MFIVLTLMMTLLTTPVMAPPPLLQKKILTPISDVELTTVLQETHIEVFGRAASRARIAMAWGQIALENGRGAVTYNHNLGNIGPYRGHPYYKHGLSKFRAFPNFKEAATVYWELLRDRCSAAMFSFDGMNAQYTAMKLRSCGYHRTDVDTYAKGLGSLMWVGYRLLG